MDLSVRKKDLADRLQLLMRETASTVELVNLLFKSCERIVDEVCDTDRYIFLTQYPLIIKYLDTRIHHALEFNCTTDNLISQGIKFKNEDVSITEARNAGDAPQLGLVPQKEVGDSLGLSERPVLDVARKRCDGVLRRPGAKSTLSDQASSCIKVIADTSKPSQDNAVPALERARDEESHKKKDQLEDVARKKKGEESRNIQTKEQDDIDAITTIQTPITLVNEKSVNGQPTSTDESQLNAATSNLPKLVEKSQNVAKSTRSTKIIDGFPESVHRPVHVGEECAVMLSYIETPGEFYVHIACEENTTLDEFQEEINTFYSNNKVTLKSKSIAKTRLGNFCVCFQPEVGWCRAQVLNWCLEEEHIEVQLVDYGDICYAFLDVIQPILPKYTCQPLYATRCHLAFIEPPPPSDTWPLESAKVFNCYMPPTTKTKPVQDSTVMQDFDVPRVYSIIKAEKDDVVYISSKENKLVHQTSISVILKDGSDSTKLTMNDNLVDLGYAESSCAEAVDLYENVIDESVLKKDKNNIVISDRMNDVENWVMNTLRSPSQVKVEKAEKLNETKNDFEETLVVLDKSDLLQDWNPMQEDFMDPSESREDAVLAVSGYNAQDEKRVCKFFAKSGHCYKGIYCKMEHSYTYQDGYTTDKELIYTYAFTPLSMPAEDSVIHVTVTHVPKGKSYFYSIIPSAFPSSRPEDDEETLASLNKHINEPRIIKAFSHLQIPPALGQMILAFSPRKTSWHRARVVNELDDGSDTIEVMFVDSGETEIVHERNVRAIQPSMLHLPFQAIECRLANVDIDDLSLASEYLQTSCLGKTLAAKVVRSLEDVQVMYCLLWDARGNDVGQSLIQAGLGFEKASSSPLIMMPL